MMTKFWRSIALAAGVAYGVAIARSQSTRVGELGVGKLLVASRDLSDPNFVKSVVLLVQYDKQGTVGLIVNRRTKTPISSILDNLNTAKRGSDPIYIGGPVEMTSVFGLFRSRKLPGASAVLSNVYLVPSRALLEKALAASSGPADLRLYVGYCGWGAGQLENEVRLGGWWVFDGNTNQVFDSYPDSVWFRLIARTERQIARAEPLGIRWPPAWTLFPAWVRISWRAKLDQSIMTVWPSRPNVRVLR